MRRRRVFAYASSSVQICDVEASLRPAGHTYKIQTALQLKRFAKAVRINKSVLVFRLQQKFCAKGNVDYAFSELGYVQIYCF